MGLKPDVLDVTMWLAAAMTLVFLATAAVTATQARDAAIVMEVR